MNRIQKAIDSLSAALAVKHTGEASRCEAGLSVALLAMRARTLL